MICVYTFECIDTIFELMNIFVLQKDLKKKKEVDW